MDMQKRNADVIFAIVAASLVAIVEVCFFFFLNVDKLVGWFMVVIVFNKIITKVKILTLWTTHLIWENSVN